MDNLEKNSLFPEILKTPPVTSEPPSALPPNSPTKFTKLRNKLSNKKVAVGFFILLLATTLTISTSLYVINKYKKTTTYPPSDISKEEALSSPPRAQIISTPIKNITTFEVINISSDGDSFFVFYPNGGNKKYQNGVVTDLPRTPNGNASWIKTAEWNGSYWLFAPGGEEESILKFDGYKYTDLTDKFKSVTDCYAKYFHFDSVSWDSQKWHLLSSKSSSTPGTNIYCFTTFDGNKFEDYTSIIPESLSNNIRSLSCNKSFCLALAKNEDDFQFYKIDPVTKSTELLTSEPFSNMRLPDYAGIISSNDNNIVIETYYTSIETYYASPDNEEYYPLVYDYSLVYDYYLYDGAESKLLARYTLPMFSEESLSGNIEDLYIKWVGSFVPDTAIWDPYRENWYIIGLTFYDFNTEIGFTLELTLMEVTEDFKTRKLVDNDPVRQESRLSDSVEHVAVSKEGIIIDYSLSALNLIKFID